MNANFVLLSELRRQANESKDRVSPWSAIGFEEHFNHGPVLLSLIS